MQVTNILIWTTIEVLLFNKYLCVSLKKNVSTTIPHRTARLNVGLYRSLTTGGRFFANFNCRPTSLLPCGHKHNLLRPTRCFQSCQSERIKELPAADQPVGAAAQQPAQRWQQQLPPAVCPPTRAPLSSDKSASSHWHPQLLGALEHFQDKVLGCVTQRADLWLNIFLDATPASWLSWIWEIIAWRSCLLFQAIWSPWRSSLCSASKLQWRHLRR